MIVISALLLLLLLSLYIISRVFKGRLYPDPNLPPGSLGWPLIGESTDFIRTGLSGQPGRFVRERIEKYDAQVFKTSLFGESMIVFCGPAANKFLFSNENKLVNNWWPSSVKKLMPSSLSALLGDEARNMRRILMTFLDPDALKKYTQKMDFATQHHVRTYWEGKEEIRVLPTVNLYTFDLACRLFTSIDDPTHISKLAAEFDIFLKGVVGFSFNIPGTRFYQAMKAANVIKKDLRLIARQRREALDKKLASPAQDLLSHLLMTADASGKFLTETQIVDNILLLLFASHDTTTSAITCVMKYLAELPEAYEIVLREQIDIAKSKEPGELLKWEDMQKMRYSWNVVCEVMRLMPPVRGAFREAIVDFTYAGYTIPRGWKLHWSPLTTNTDPTIFPKAENFDASRFEGAGPIPYSWVPFGGGPRICLGNEYARLQILVFLHNIVKRFRWNLSIPDEKFAYDPMPAPSQGLPINLQSQQSVHQDAYRELSHKNLNLCERS